jgi:hypothetical protein
VSDDQKRAAERIPLEKPIEVTVNDVEGRIVEISLIGCRVEHAGRLKLGSSVTMHFVWGGERIRLKAKVSRTEMRSIGGKPGYVSALALAASLDESPNAIRKVIASLVGETIEEVEESTVFEPEPVEQPTPPPGAKAALPPTTRATRKPPTPVPKVTPRPAPFLLDHDDIEEMAASDEIVGDDEIEEMEAIEQLGQAEKVDESPLRYVECTFVRGKWIKRHVNDPKQPREGFTMIAPESEDDLDQFCRTYEVADPDTRRLIRVSFDLTIAQRNRR